MAVKYIILHWTGGNHKPCITDLQSYQLVIDKDGKIYGGEPVGQASSCGGMNSITYNISCCGGLQHTPITPIQIEAMYKAAAQKILEFNLDVNKVYTHAEIGEMCKTGAILKLLPNNSYLKQNIGKVDLITIPNLKGTPRQTGDYIRNKVRWYLGKL